MIAPKKKHGSTNQNPKDISFIKLLKEDFKTHDSDLFEQGLWAIAVHRFGNWRMDLKPKLLRAPFSILYKILFKLVEITCGITLPYTVKLGRRVRIWHHSGMILHAESIGNDVHIRHNTTMGVVRTFQNFELPIIEDRVDIGAGVCMLGRIRIGHDSAIGANAVVLKDIPPHSVAAGVPAKVIKRLQ
jgi:serine O-acetyltransferase